MEELNLRASALPLAYVCPGSVRPPKLAIQPAGGPGALGSCMHEVLRPLAEGGDVPWDRLPEYAEKYGVDLVDLRIVVAGALKLWKLVRDSFPEAVTEVELAAEISPGVMLTGHVDLLAAPVANIARGGDWKSSWKDHDYSQQMRAYLVLVLLDDRSLTGASMSVLWTRSGDVENYSMTREEARAWVEELLAHVVRWDGVYHPSERCEWCPRYHECDAAKMKVRTDVEAVLGLTDIPDLRAMTPRQIIDLLHRAQQLGRFAERIPGYVKAFVVENGDVVDGDPLDDDAPRLTISRGEKRAPKTRELWAFLEDSMGFGTAEFEKVVSLGLGDIEDIVAKRAGKGKGAAAIRDMNEKMVAARAVDLVPTTRLVDRKGRRP